MTAIGAALSGFVKLQNLGDNFPDGKVAEVQWCWGATGDKTIVDSWIAVWAAIIKLKQAQLKTV